jgi:lipopolysaccharide biosynthesis protein
MTDLSKASYQQRLLEHLQDAGQIRLLETDPSRVPEPEDNSKTAVSMCWYRPDALAALFEHGFDYPDFEPESGQICVALMHLVERSLVYVAGDAGFSFRIAVPAEHS